MDSTTHKPIDRVVLACIQCRGRHVKCDATQPICNRCRRDGKECTYQKSRRGGLDKAALARRREKLQQQAAGNAQTNASQDRSLELQGSGRSEYLQPGGFPSTDLTAAPIGAVEANQATSQVALQISTERLLDAYYENNWAALPAPLPRHHLDQRRLTNNHRMKDLLLVLQYMGSIFAPWTLSESHYEAAREALESPGLPRTPWNVQALMIFALAQLHTNRTRESRRSLDAATSIALELSMNTKEFAIAYGEGDPVLEESWRRTYYFLALTDQHFSVIVNNPRYALMNVANLADLPCDDEAYKSGNIPPPKTWQQYDMREFDDVEVEYSSIAYLADISRVTRYVMTSFVETGVFNAAFVDNIDAKLAVWRSLLPASKRDPMRSDGSLDEVMFLAHLMSSIIPMAAHRPFSSLEYSFEELTTLSFSPPVPFMNAPKHSRPVHTARTLKACDMQTKLLAIPCAVEKHNVMIGCIIASIATAQIAACKLLEDHALAIARDRVRLSIGYLNTLGAIWQTFATMAKEVRFVARSALRELPSTLTSQPISAAEIEVPRDELIWPVDPSAQIDIYAGMNIPMDFDPQQMGYSSSSTSSS